MAGWVEAVIADGWVQGLIEVAAVLAACGVIVGTAVKVWRAMRSTWAQAVAGEVDPKIQLVREEVVRLRADGDTRFTRIDETLAEIHAALHPNGGLSFYDKVTTAARIVEDDDEATDRAREGGEGRRVTDPKGERP